MSSGLFRWESLPMFRGNLSVQSTKALLEDGTDRFSRNVGEDFP